MNVTMQEFYKEVVGGTRSTAKMLDDLKKWGIPTTLRGTGTGKRVHHQVDVQHLSEAKAKWELEKATAPPPRANGALHVSEQKLDEVLSRIRGIEVALNALMKLAKS